jgi:uncharacterized protein HemX
MLTRIDKSGEVSPSRRKDRTMKRLAATALVILVAGGVAGCGAQKSSEHTSPTTNHLAEQRKAEQKTEVERLHARMSKEMKREDERVEEAHPELRSTR